MSTSASALAANTSDDPTLFHAGEGEPLVLIHGFASFWRFWEPVLPWLIERHEVYAFDLPGFGASAPLEAEPTPYALADAIEARLDGLGLDTPHVAGHSMGGLLALEVARRGRARTVTGIAPSGPSSDKGMRRAKSMLAAQRTMGRVLNPVIDPLAGSAVARTLTLGLSASRPWAMDGDWFRAQARTYIDAPGFDATLAALDPNPVASRFHTIDVPIVLAYGSRDLIVPTRSAARYRNILPDSTRYVMLKGTGHATSTDAPEQVAAVILDATGALAR